MRENQFNENLLLTCQVTDSKIENGLSEKLHRGNQESRFRLGYRRAESAHPTWTEFVGLSPFKNERTPSYCE